MKEEIEIFVPGRLCLFGEHSDWAGGHRRQNSEIEKGYVIVCQTNQGIYARAKKREDGRLKIKSTLDDGILDFEIDMRADKLKSEAERGGLFSYVAGVGYYVLEQFDNGHIGGIEINNYKTDLPVKKGLSSSASICVLNARAFNRIYGLKLSTRGEMDIAYKGEVLTPSRCGRMDQACAFSNPVLMSFDGDFVDVEELKVGKEMNFIVVDLKGQKDTKKILHELNKSYPFAQSEEDRRVQRYLGEINKGIVCSATGAIEQGDIEEVGKLMRFAQKKFDECLMERCSELKALKLHKVLEYEKIQELVYGGKGVGSQGDGCAQLLCRGIEERARAAGILERELGVKCYELDVRKNVM